MWVRSFVAVTIGLAFLAPASAQNNTGQQLIDGTATFEYAFGGSGNLPTGPPIGSGNVSMNFQLAGSPGDPAEQQIVKGNWFYRVLSGAGDTRERYLVDASSKMTSGTDYVKWDFSAVYGAGAIPIPGISAEMDFQLTSNGPNSASFSTGLCFTNNSPAPFEVETFFAIDLSLDASTAGDDFQLLSMPGGGRLIQAVDGLTTGTLFGSIATGSSMDSASNLFGHNFSDTFPDVNSLVGGDFGDGAALLQFNQVIFPGSSSLCDPLTFSVTRIPEPSGLSLAGVLLLFAAFRRGRWLTS